METTGLFIYETPQIKYLFVSQNRILEVSEQIVRVAKVTVGPALCRSVPQLFHNGQIRSSNREVQY